jgi:hypothetical protein
VARRCARSCACRSEQVGLALDEFVAVRRALLTAAITMLIMGALGAAPASADQTTFDQAVEGASGLTAYFPLSADYSDAVSGGPTLAGEGSNLAKTGGPWWGSGEVSFGGSGYAQLSGDPLSSSSSFTFEVGWIGPAGVRGSGSSISGRANRVT